MYYSKKEGINFVFTMDEDVKELDKGDYRTYFGLTKFTFRAIKT